MAKALTVCQPWAWAIIHGPKRIENRPRLTHYRGKLYIHAGLSLKWMKTFNEQYRHTLPGLKDRDLLFGYIIGSVDLVDCVPVSEVEGQPFAWGPWCWIMANPNPLKKPIPYKGQLGLFNIPEEIINKTVR